MSTSTTYLGLNKPAMTDTPGTTIPQLGSNFDTIDSAIISAFIPSAYVLNLQGLTIGNCIMPPYNVQLGTITLG